MFKLSTGADTISLHFFGVYVYHCTPSSCMQQYTFLQYLHVHKTNTLKQCAVFAPMFSVHVYIAKMYIAAYISLGVDIHTMDELTESNVGIVLDEILDHF